MADRIYLLPDGGSPENWMRSLIVDDLGLDGDVADSLIGIAAGCRRQ